MSNSQISNNTNKKMNTKKSAKQEQKMFDMSKGTLWSVFRVIWIPTLVSMVLGGTLVVVDSLFVSLGFGPWQAFSEVGLNLSGDAYSALGGGAIAMVQPYFLIIAATGIMIGAGTAIKMGKAKATGNMIEYQRLLNSFLPKTIMVGGILAIALILLAKPLIYMGSGFQSTYAENWMNNPLMNQGGWENFNYEALYAELEVAGDVESFVIAWNTGMGYDVTGMKIDLTDGSYLSEQLNAIDTSVAGWQTNAAALTLSETPMAAGHVLDQGARYLQIQAVFAIFFMLVTSSAFILRMEGKAFIATYTGIVMLVINLGLDFLLVNMLGGNLVGAVIATGIAQLVAAQITLWYMRNRFPTRVNKRDWSFGKSTLKGTLKEGTPAFALQLASILLQWGTIFSMGIVFRDWSTFSILTSGFQGFFSIYTLFFLIASATIMSITPIISYNQTVGNYQRVRAARTLGYSMVIGWALFATAIGTFFPHIIAIVATKDPATTYFAMQYAFMAFAGGAITLMNSNYLQARGNRKMSNVASFFKSALIVPLSIGMGFGMKNVDVSGWIIPAARQIDSQAVVGAGMFLAGPILDILGGIITSVPLVKDFKLLKKQANGEEIPTVEQRDAVVSKPKATKASEWLAIASRKNLEELTVAELKEYATRVGFKVPSNIKKERLIYGLRAWRHPEQFKVAELQILAEKLDIQGRTRMKKADLVKAIKSKK